MQQNSIKKASQVTENPYKNPETQPKKKEKKIQHVQTIVDLVD